jgi:transposase-like protein
MARQQMSTNGNELDKRNLLQAAQTLDSESDIFRIMNEETGMTVLTPQQWQAIGLLVSGKRQSEIARELDISEETLSRWRNSPIYGAALNQAVRDSYSSTMGLVRDSIADAVMAIRGCLQSEDDRVRLQAALALVKIHLQLDSAALALPTTPAKVADVQLRNRQMSEMDRLLLSL